MSRWAAQLLTAETALFSPQPRGWVGADAAASVVLNSTHLLWLWGDTLLGRSTAHHRDIEHFVHGSIALQERRRSAAPRYFVRHLDGEPDLNGFFQPGGNSTAHGGTYYWTVNGASLASADEADGPLLVLAMAMSSTGMMEQLGTDAIILHPRRDAPPQSWHYETQRIPASSANVSFNQGVWVDADDGQVYLIGGRARKNFGPITQQLLARIPNAALRNFSWGAMRFWDGSGWVESVEEAAPIFNESYTEGSLGRLGGGATVGECFYFIGLQAYQPCVGLYTAPRLTGPWTPEPLYTLPPLPPNATIAYAAKSHPALLRAPPHEGDAASGDVAAKLLITYNTNGGGFPSLEASPQVYHPIFVQLTLNCSAAAHTPDLPQCAARVGS